MAQISGTCSRIWVPHALKSQSKHPSSTIWEWVKVFFMWARVCVRARLKKRSEGKPMRNKLCSSMYNVLYLPLNDGCRFCPCCLLLLLGPGPLVCSVLMSLYSQAWVYFLWIDRDTSSWTFIAPLSDVYLRELTLVTRLYWLPPASRPQCLFFPSLCFFISLLFTRSYMSWMTVMEIKGGRFRDFWIWPLKQTKKNFLI